MEYLKNSYGERFDSKDALKSYISMLWCSLDMYQKTIVETRHREGAVADQLASILSARGDIELRLLEAFDLYKHFDEKLADAQKPKLEIKEKSSVLDMRKCPMEEVVDTFNTLNEDDVIEVDTSEDGKPIVFVNGEEVTTINRAIEMTNAAANKNTESSSPKAKKGKAKIK